MGDENSVDIGIQFQINRASAVQARKDLERELSKLTLNINRPELKGSGKDFRTGTATGASVRREITAQEEVVAAATQRLGEVREKLASDALKYAKAESNLQRGLAGAIKAQAQKTLSARDALLSEQASLTRTIDLSERVIYEAFQAYAIELRTGAALLKARNASTRINSRRGEGANEGEGVGRGTGSRAPGPNQPALSESESERERKREDFLISRNRQEYINETERQAAFVKSANQSAQGLAAEIERDAQEFAANERAQKATEKKDFRFRAAASQRRINIARESVREAEAILAEEKKNTRATNAELIARQNLVDRLKEINRKADSALQKNFGNDAGKINNNIGGGFSGGGGGGRGGSPGAPSPDGPNKFRQSLENMLGALRRTDTAAFDFGETIRGTAVRLLAWGVTAKIVFDTLSKFRQAVDEVVELDKQVRRLVFFQTAGGPGGVEAFNKSFGDTATKSKQLGEAFRAITDEAQRTGLSIREVVAAANTVARIGGNPFENIGGSLRPTDFLLATEALTQLEGGLLSADRAAELLQATTAQFGLQLKDGTRDLTNFTVVAARLASVANATSFGVEELGSVVARFGSAALNVQRLSFDQSLELAGVAAKVLGTNASRTATALRQLTTRIAERADDIEALTGIEIKTENGQLVGYPALVNALKAIDSLKGSALQIQLAKDIGDAETISDVLALAGAYEEVQEAILSLEDADVAAKRAADQVEAFLKQAATQSDSAASSLNKLNAAFVQLAQSSGVDALIASVANTFRAGVNQATAFVDAIYKSESALKLLSGAITALGITLGKKLLIGFAGSLSFLGANLTKEINGILGGAINPERFQGATQKLFDSGRISGERQLSLNQRNSLIVNSIKATEIEIGRQAAIINSLKSTGLGTVQQIERHELALEGITQRRIALIRQEENLRNRVSAAAAKPTGGTTILNNAGTIIGVASALGAPFIAELFASGFKDARTSEIIKSGIEKTLTGAGVGATIGSILPGLGTGIGAAIGAAIGAISSAFGETDFDKSAREQLKLTEEIGKKRTEAERTVRRQISVRAAEESAIGSRQAKAVEKLAIINSEIEAIQNEIAEGGIRKLQLQNLEDKLASKVLIRKRLEKETSKEEEASLSRRLALEERLVDLKAIGAIATQGLDIKKQIEKQLNDLASGGALNKGKAILIDFDIDKEKIRSEIETLALTGKQIDIRIRELSASKSKDDKDELRRLIRTREEVVNSIVAKELEVVSKQVQAASDLLNNSREAARTIIKSYEDAGKKLEESFTKIDQISKNITDNILKSVGQIIQVNKGGLELDNAQGARRGTNLGTGAQDRFSKSLRDSLSTLGDARQIEKGNFSGPSAAAGFLKSVLSSSNVGRFIPGRVERDGQFTRGSGTSATAIADLTALIAKQVEIETKLATADKLLPESIKALQDELDNTRRGIQNAVANRTVQNQDLRTAVRFKAGSSVTAREESVQVITNLFNELAIATNEAKDANNLEAQAKVVSIQKQISAEQQAFAQNANFLNQEQALLDERIKITNELIASEREAIEIIRKRAAEEAKLGASALDDPNKFIEDVRKSLSAQNFFKSLGLGGGKLNAALRPFDVDKNNRIEGKERDGGLPVIAKIFSEAIQKLGKRNFSALQTLREQLLGAGRIGAKVGGLGPEEILQLLERSVFKPGGALAADVADEQNRGVTVEAALADQITAFQALKAITDERVKDERALREIELARQKVLKDEVAAIESQQLPAALTAVKTESVNLKVELENLKKKVIEITSFTSDLGISFSDLDGVLEKIAKIARGIGTNDPSGVERERGKGKAPGGGKIIATISNESLENISSRIVQAFADGSTSITNALNGSTVNAVVPPIEIALNANVKSKIDGEDFIASLTEALKISGLEVQISQIRDVIAKLLKIELGRGNDIPLPPNGGVPTGGE